jgi:hypothetical protein
MPITESITAHSRLPPLSFEAVVYEFRKRGVVIKRLPGEYSIGYLNAQSQSAEIRETLAEAIEMAETMANEAPATTARAAVAGHRKRHASMTPKAIIKRRIKAHNMRRRARAIKAAND